MRDGRAADCVDPLFDGLTVEVDSAVAYDDGECFPGDLGALVIRPRDGLTLFGADQALTNDQILRADNAAVALRLLGQDGRLVWYVPSLGDLAAGDGVSLKSLLPALDPPGTLGRRDRDGHGDRLAGPPARAAGRRAAARRRTRGRDHPQPGPALPPRRRPRTRRRVAAPGGAHPLRRTAPARARFDPAGLVREVARRTGRPGPRSPTCCHPPPGDPGPATDRDLITLANDLAELDREVRRT